MVKMTKNRFFPIKFSFYKNLSMHGEIQILSLKTYKSRVPSSSAKSFQNDIAAIVVENIS